MSEKTERLKKIAADSAMRIRLNLRRDHAFDAAAYGTSVEVTMGGTPLARVYLLDTHEPNYDFRVEVWSLPKSHGRKPKFCRTTYIPNGLTGPRDYYVAELAVARAKRVLERESKPC